jgi:hypothetical protein
MVSIYAAIGSVFLYYSVVLLCKDPLLAEFVQVMGKLCVLFPVLLPLMFPVILWLRVRGLVVTVDENGIEVRSTRLCRQVQWKAVTSFKFNPARYNPSPLYLFGDENTGLSATPIIAIPPFVDCRAIAEILEDYGVPRK